MARKHRPRQQVQLICPKCLAPEVDRDPLMFGGPAYRCRKCGYNGPLVLEREVADGTVDAGGSRGTA